MFDNKVLIIAGMHRSGTSLITQWLSRCGLPVGERLLGPLVGNEEGHFEDLDFVDVHKEILREQQLPDTGLATPAALEVSYHSMQKIKRIIFLKNEINNQWGWKDPRTCLFLPIYRQLIPGANYFFIVRDYASSVSSLINRIYYQAEKKYLARSWFSAFFWKNIRSKRRKKILYKKFSQPYLKVWIAYNEQILLNISRLPKHDYILVDYNVLNKEGKLIFSHLKETWNFSLNYFDFNEIFKRNLLTEADDISSFVKDKTLLDKAEKLENSLRSFCFTNKYGMRVL